METRMIAPKPLPAQFTATKTPRKPRRMTIAIGMLCHEGLIIAADTRIAMTDGTTREGIKVHQAIADTGIYVTANATEDGNAANTLIPELLIDLQTQDPKNFAQLEKIVKELMSEWASRHPHGIPRIEILLGVNINRPKQLNIRTGGGLRLYLCEPPNTMIPIDIDDASEGYKAIGAASSVANPIFRDLFTTACSANTGFHQIAYLMYRAKKDAAALCGGHTNALLLKSEFSPPAWVDPIYMETAEMYGEVLDFCLKMTVFTVFASTDEAAAAISDANRPYNISQGRLFRSHRFLTPQGEDVGLPPISLQKDSEDPVDGA
jgi:20S proteasome alpha/beta subunit